MPHATRRAALTAGLAATLARTASAAPAETPVRLFRVVGPRQEVTIGLTAAELDRMGAAPDTARIARRLVREGHLTAWQYAVGRAPDGSRRFAGTGRIAILRYDTLWVEPCAAAIPVAPPPVA